jgi:hypothetical protein
VAEASLSSSPLLIYRPEEQYEGNDGFQSAFELAPLRTIRTLRRSRRRCWSPKTAQPGQPTTDPSQVRVPADR